MAAATPKGVPSNNKSSREGKKTAKKAPKKQEKNDELSIKVIAVIVLLAVGFFLFSSNVGKDGESIFDNEEDSQLSVSLEAFEYVNDYRISEDVSPLRYSAEAALVANRMNEKKQVNSGEFQRVSDRTAFVNENLKTGANFSSYVGIYIIDGNGASEFKRQFDDNYFMRNIIRDSKYEFGAIECSEDYCTLILYTFDE